MASSSTKPIPEQVWNDHKAIILGLVNDHTKAQIMDKLREEHNFNVTVSQLEAKLKAWNHRKNLSHEEWEIVLNELDNLSRSQGHTRLSISGRPVLDNRIKRARRHCGAKRAQLRHDNSKAARFIDLSQVRIDVQHEDGQWHMHTGFQQNMSSTTHSTSPPIDRRSSSPVAKLPESLSDHELSEHPTNILPPSALEPTDTASLDGLDVGSHKEPSQLASHLNGAAWSMPGLVTDFDFSAMAAPPQLDECFSLANITDSTVALSPTSIPLYRLDTPDILGLQLYCSWKPLLNDLSCKVFERQLKAQGINIRDDWLITPPTRPSQTTLHNPLQAVPKGVRKHVPMDFRTLLQKHTRDAERALSSLKHLLPLSPHEDNEPTPGSLISEDDAFFTDLNRKLVWSMINGFAGLQDLSIGDVLKHLTHYRHTSSLLLQFLRNDQSHVARSLAEGLFRAAIESRDEAALQAVLKARKIDVNNTLCIVNGRKFTPIGRAAYLGTYAVVKRLRQAGVKFNESPPVGTKALLIDLLDGLRALVEKNDSSQLSTAPEVVNIAKEFLELGSKVTSKTLGSVLNIFKSSQASKHFWRLQGGELWTLRVDLTRLIAMEAIRLDHSEVLRQSQIAELVGALDDCHAKEAIELVLSTCQQHDGSVCRTQASTELDWALVVAARLGKLGAVQSLLHISTNLSRVLSGAIRSGNAEVIDLVLTRHPDLIAPAHNIDDDEFSDKYNQLYPPRRSREGYTTSYSEAITAGNDKLIKLIERNEYMDVLDKEGRLNPALTAAVKTNDMHLLRHLLNRSHSPLPNHLAPALHFAVMAGNDEAAMVLMNSGATIHAYDDESPLSNAQASRHVSIIRELLTAFSSSPDDIHIMDAEGRLMSIGVIEEVMNWADVTVLSDILTTFSGLIVSGGELLEALRRHDKGLFDCLIASKRVTREAVTTCLQHPISIGDRQLIRDLVDSGADPSHGEILRMATEEHPSMLDAILEQIPRATMFRDPGAGRTALKQALRRGVEGLKQVEDLLKSGFVDPWGVFIPEEDNFNVRWSPFGVAIMKCGTDRSGDRRMVKLFLDAGGDPNKIGYTREEPLENRTILLLSIETGDLELVKLLFEHKADVNKSATHRILRTPLQRACEVGDLEMVKLLLENGADPNGSPARCLGATALQLAAISGNCNIAAELLNYGANLDQPPVKAGGRWPLEGAAENGRVDMIEYLWKVKTVLTGEGFEAEICKYAMQYAEDNGHLACRDFIRELMVNGLPDPTRASTDRAFDVS